MQVCDSCLICNLKGLGVVDIGLIQRKPDGISESVDLKVEEVGWSPKTKIEEV